MILARSTVERAPSSLGLSAVTSWSFAIVNSRVMSGDEAGWTVGLGRVSAPPSLLEATLDDETVIQMGHVLLSDTQSDRASRQADRGSPYLSKAISRIARCSKRCI